MIWFLITFVIILFVGMMIFLLFIGMEMFLKGTHKVNTDDKVLVRYLFVYKIVEGDPNGLPTEFLVNWKLTDLENHMYLLYLNLEEDLDIEKYLYKVLAKYYGFNNIYGKVYRIEYTSDIKNILIGTWEVVEGRIGYNKLG